MVTSLSVEHVGWEFFLLNWETEIVNFYINKNVSRGCFPPEEYNCFDYTPEQKMQRFENYHGGPISQELYQGGLHFPPTSKSEKEQVVRKIQLEHEFYKLRAKNLTWWEPTTSDLVYHNLSLRFPPPSTQTIADVEHTLAITLPDDYKAFLQYSNGWMVHADWRIVSVEELKFADKIPKKAKAFKGRRCLVLGDLLDDYDIHYEFFIGMDVDTGEVIALQEKAQYVFEHFSEFMEWSYPLDLDCLIEIYTNHAPQPALESHEQRIEAIKQGKTVEMLDPFWKTLSYNLPVSTFAENQRNKATIQQQDVWLPALRKGEKKLASASKYGGTPWLAEDEAWPHCQLCGQPMQFLVQVNLEDIQDASKQKQFGDGLLQVFHCVSHTPCHNQEERFTRALGNMRQLTRIVKPCKHNKKHNPPEFTYPIITRNILKWKRTKETLEPLDDGKIGGSLREGFIEQRIRYWADYSRIPSCSTCGQHMAFFALFIPDCPDDFIMLVFVFQCEAHDELTTGVCQQSCPIFRF